MKRPVAVALMMPVTDEYWRGVVQGVTKYTGAARPWMMMRVDPKVAEFERLPIVPEGIIASVETPDVCKFLESNETACVTVSSAVAECKLPHVYPDDASIGMLAAGHFLQRGVRHYGYLGVAGREDSQKRQNAYIQRLNREEVRQIHLHQTTLADDAHHHQALISWLSELPRPCAVFAFSDELARRVIDSCWALGLKVPKDIAILGVGDDPIVCGLALPRLSSVSLPAERVGYESAVLLEKLMAGKRRGVESVVMPVSSVITRASTDIVSIKDPQVAEAVRFILAHAGEWIGVRELLMSMPIQRRSLERKFRAALGRSPLEEIRRVRLDIARELLSTTDLPMPLVARRAGFSEAKQLSTVFRAEVGMTPTEYRGKFRVVNLAAEEPSKDGQEKED